MQCHFSPTSEPNLYACERCGRQVRSIHPPERIHARCRAADPPPMIRTAADSTSNLNHCGDCREALICGRCRASGIRYQLLCERGHCPLEKF